MRFIGIEMTLNSIIEPYVPSLETLTTVAAKVWTMCGALRTACEGDEFGHRMHRTIIHRLD